MSLGSRIYQHSGISELIASVHFAGSVPAAMNMPLAGHNRISTRKFYPCDGLYRSPYFSKLYHLRRCQIWTNLGLALNTVGRPIVAIEAWDEALAIEPNFGMAAANRGNGLAYYGAAVTHSAHECALFNAAAEGFRAALSEHAIFCGDYPQSMFEQFRENLTAIEAHLSKKCGTSSLNPDELAVGTCSHSATLNEWRTSNRLFLNPLNDIAISPLAAQDVIQLPLQGKRDRHPSYCQWFDLIKQEYVAACVLHYESLDKQNTHPADKTLPILDYGDNSIFSVKIEKRKAALRISYSLLDKCAALINAYFEIGHDPSKVSFRKVWFENIRKRDFRKGITFENWRLRGLYAISRDLFDEDFRQESSPLAAEMNNARNAAEHRGLLIYDGNKPEPRENSLDSVTELELSDLVMNALKLSRETIISLSLAVCHQETHRDKFGQVFQA